MKKYINPYNLFIGSFIPNWLLKRSEISPGAKLCYARLCQFAGRNGDCHPKQETLAKEFGCSRSQVIRYLKELERCKLIEKLRIGLRCSNRYKFLDHQWIRDDPMSMKHQEVADLPHQEVAEEALPKERESKEKNVSNDTKARTPVSEMFGIFLRYWKEFNGGEYMFRPGKDGKIAQSLYKQCVKEKPQNPLSLFEERTRGIFEQFEAKEFGGILYFWNRVAPPKHKQEGRFIPFGRE